MPYLPLESYGLIGDLRTAALVGDDGSIDWLCYPRFDSSSVFGAILDDGRGGRFRIAPAGDSTTTRQLYLPETNVLVTRFMSPEGIVELTDFMPVPPEHDLERPPRLVRRVRVVTGEVELALECRPAFDYARADHALELGPDGAVFRPGGSGSGPDQPALRLTSSVPLEADAADPRRPAAVARFRLREDEEATFHLGGAARPTPSAEELERRERQTILFWRAWIGSCSYQGRWREVVRRSALTLKLLTYAPTGAIVAAPTTSLPEWIGGERNWDYRYTWLRDAAFTVYALMRIGLEREAADFMRFVEARCHELEPSGALRVMYRIDGGHDIPEQTLDHLEGYAGSRPVRVGNAAHEQFQLDVYGELVDAIYLFNKHGEPISHDLWTEVREMLGWVCEHWREDDEGIWEVRGPRRPFVLSKVMCWVALERGIRIASQRGLPGELELWRRERDAIYAEVMERGYSEEAGAFVQSYGSLALDAANLLLPLVKFVGPREPRMLATIDRTLERLTHEPLVHRYLVGEAADDGLVSPEGAFSACSFWLVECLTRAGRLEEARLMFEKMLAFASPLGLMSEQVGLDGRALGNTPQALTHLALISAAVHLDRALGSEGGRT